MGLFNYKRRKSGVVTVGNVKIGGDNPVKLQSMTNTSTNDIVGSARQIERIAAAGADLVRLTTQGVREAEAIADIKAALSAEWKEIPLVADVHFNPNAAYKALETCEKVRINPGNFADPPHQFQLKEYSDEEYAAELLRIEEKVAPFFKEAARRGRAIRLGVNHGSLSDRIVSRYGDTPLGMVESLMEYLRIAERVGFRNIVLSIKASNVVVMVETVRLLADAMAQEEMDYPLHLGVTEAGNEDEGRIKSAVGIGTLLSLGLGDTIRVSLSEAPEREIPVAKILRDYIAARKDHDPIVEPAAMVDFPARQFANRIPGAPSVSWPLVEGMDFSPVDSGAFFIDASEEVPSLPDASTPVILSSVHKNPVGEMASWIERFIQSGGKNPVVIRLRYEDSDRDTVVVKAAADFGALLLLGYSSGIRLEAPALSEEERNDVALGILQAVRLRFSKPDYIACPSCGRTLFNLEETLAKVKAATSHLKGLKIAVMGCIVNGPGEMADADYGYVGAGPGMVTLYKGKNVVRKNIPEGEAIEALLDLIDKDR